MTSWQARQSCRKVNLQWYFICVTHHRKLENAQTYCNGASMLREQMPKEVLYVLDKVIGEFLVAFGEDRVNTWCHCMAQSWFRRQTLHVLCVLMPRVMCKITSLLRADQMILDGTMVLCHAWCHTTKYMKCHIVSHDVFEKKCNDASWGYTDSTASAW